jgi:hypothetical protein
MKSKIVGLMAFFFIISCVSIFAMGEQDSAAKGTVLYSVGSYKGKPCYWQNTVRKNLSIPSGAKEGVASAITVGDDGTVYIAGYYGDNLGSYYEEKSAKPCYWKNGVRKDLPIPSRAESCEPSAITVGTDGTVYILSSFGYWQDRGGRIGISDSFPAETWGKAIAVGTNGTVYIAGSYNDDYRNPFSIKPCYLQNAVRKNLPIPSGAKGGRASAITVGNDGTVYITGETGWYSNSAEGGKTTPCYWQNEVRKELPLPSGVSSEFTAAITITIGNDGTVYIVCSYYACYWQNGVRKDLPIPNGTEYSKASAIAAGTDGTVYVSGSYYGNKREVVCYWQGNTRHDIGTLEEGEVINSQFIFIK